MKYKTIVIDPPWDIGHNFAPHKTRTNIERSNEKFKKYFSFRQVNGNVHNKKNISYNMMTDNDLRAWKIPVEVNDDAVLFLWCIHQKVKLGLELIEQWGFTYKHILTWCKLPSTRISEYGNRIPSNPVCTNGFNRNSELLIFARMGRDIVDKNGTTVPFVFSEKIGKHSEKPPGIYQLLRDKFPEPRIDIFARRRHIGFDAYGDQVESEIQEVLI